MENGPEGQEWVSMQSTRPPTVSVVRLPCHCEACLRRPVQTRGPRRGTAAVHRRRSGATVRCKPSRGALENDVDNLTEKPLAKRFIVWPIGPARQ